MLPVFEVLEASASHVFIEGKEPRDVIDVQTMWDILIDGSMKCVPDECKYREVEDPGCKMCLR
jgi:hypothetical protein